MEKKVLAIVQARSDSKRLPNKILLKLNKKNVIETIYERLLKSRYINQIIVATTTLRSDDKFCNFLDKKNIKYFRGSSNNVLDRYLKAAKKFNGNIIVRITGDCPLIDIKIVDKVIKNYLENKVEYSSNINPPTFPNGLDVEVFSLNLIKKNFKNIRNQYDLEHVTTFFRKSEKIKKINYEYKRNLSNLRLTLDDSEDYKSILNIFKYFKNKNFTTNEVIKYLDNSGSIYKKIHIRDDFNELGTGQKLWKKAKSIIPGGNMLISKRGEFFLPELWPSYYKKSSGCHIWDLDNKKYIDMALMGVGTNILGYSFKPVDNAVISSIRDGNMSSLNCREEVLLAEKLIEMNSWSGMVKFAKTGAEASSIAVRIARSYSRKDNIAICGYHGWHDWYLASNLKNKESLNSHLLKGLYTSGVPKKLKNTVFSFNYNDFDQLTKIIKKHNIGTIKMEVMRNVIPKNNFLLKVRDISNKNNIVLIFDECTSGFREFYGGMYNKFKINPDIVIYGKAIANGYPLTAVVGKREIMEHANNSFISSTFWTDRVGYVAALKTLEYMTKTNSWKKISFIGKKIKNNWEKLAKKYNLKINISGIDALPSFTLLYDDWIKYKTFITQEMLKNNILATNTIYVSLAHKDVYIKKYFVILESIFKKINNIENDEDMDIDSYLESLPAQTTFGRMN